MTACIFDCGDAADDTMIDVEMNVDADGKFHPHQNHAEVNHQGPPIVSERVPGVAHERCYAEWYHKIYKTPFTMSA